MTFKKNFLIFLILLKCLFLVNSTPADPRYVHATVVVNNNLYVMGGFSNGLPSREFFSLDLSQPFDATTPPWKDLTTTSPLPVSISWAKARVAPETRREFASVSDPLTGKLYIHGGLYDLSVPTNIYFNNFFILDGNNLSWSQIGKTGPNIPPSRIDHAAVLIANGVIVFIGGREYSITPKASITALTLYDTKTDTWDLMTTVGGLDINSRIGHTAVYAANGQIIVYGGCTPALELTPTPELAVLDTTIKPFKWITPPVTTPEAPINSVTHHQADLIGDYMVVTFGNITNKFGPLLKASNSIQILNIVDYKWVKSFPGLSPSSKTSSTTALSPTTILATVVSVGFALIIAASIGENYPHWPCGNTIYKYKEKPRDWIQIGWALNSVESKKNRPTYNAQINVKKCFGTIQCEQCNAQTRPKNKKHGKRVEEQLDKGCPVPTCDGSLQ
ncbi:2162_t:CDS:2 [Entrophospora sp. SA101]|nr:2162_t:CDS:2 [Entrophospora sp. SA101]